MDSPDVTLRVLVVDDNEKWRDVACSILSARSDLAVVAQASNGLQAVERARDLQPDIVVLDIGLPLMNGFEVARTLHELSPISRIIFLSAHKSQEVVSAGLDLGISAFVAKVDSFHGLSAAIDSILMGRRFISKSADNPITAAHELEVFRDDADLLTGFTTFAKSHLEAGNVVILLASESHLVELHRNLLLGGVGVSDAISLGTYIPMDVRDALSSFMVGGRTDPDRFKKVTDQLFRSAVQTAKGNGAKVVACGEGAPTLWNAGNFQDAVELERLWDEFSRLYSVPVLCGYIQYQGIDLAKIPSFTRLCCYHTAVRG